MKQLRIISLICALCLFLSACASQQPEDAAQQSRPTPCASQSRREPALLISAA